MAITLSLRQAAQESGLSQRTLQYAIAEGRLRSVRVGRRRLVPVTALQSFLLHGEASTGPEGFPVGRRKKSDKVKPKVQDGPNPLAADSNES